MNSQTAFRTLGVDETVSLQDLKTAYHTLVKKLHPDINKGGEERLKQVNVSYAYIVQNYEKLHRPGKHPFVHVYRQRDVEVWLGPVLYRVLHGTRRNWTVVLPYDACDYEDIMLHCYATDLDKEFRLHLKKDTKLPTILNVTYPLECRITLEGTLAREY